MTPQNVLVINSGSSSLKYQLLEAGSGDLLAKGLAERIGEDGGRLLHSVPSDARAGAGGSHERDLPLPDHRAAFAAMSQAFDRYGPSLEDAGLVGVGHRVVQGGARFGRSVIIDDDGEKIIEDLSDLAPLHNPANLVGIRAARQEFPRLPQVAVFDTAFHLDMPESASSYAIDREVARRYRIRRYGFHGTSHASASREAARLLGREPAEVNVIVLHLGNGASACAVRGGHSVETSMGLTPLEGLVMGTRSGDIDPAVVFHLARSAGMDVEAIDDLLNKRSGVLGLSGHQDMRDLVAAADGGDPDAELAFAVYVHRIRKYLGAYTAVLGRVDAVVFTAGVGENSAVTRSRVIEGLGVLGLELDDAANAAPGRDARDIAAPSSPVRILVVPANEELEIARQTVQVISAAAD